MIDPWKPTLSQNANQRETSRPSVFVVGLSQADEAMIKQSCDICRARSGINTSALKEEASLRFLNFEFNAAIVSEAAWLKIKTIFEFRSTSLKLPAIVLTEDMQSVLLSRKPRSALYMTRPVHPELISGVLAELHDEFDKATL